VYVNFRPAVLPARQQTTAQVTAQVENKVKTSEINLLKGNSSEFPDLTAQVTAQVIAQVLTFCMEPRKASEIMVLLELKHWKTFQKNYLTPLLESEIIERTIPDKPRSSRQKYRPGSKGRRPRQARIDATGTLHHIICKGHARRNIQHFLIFLLADNKPHFCIYRM